MKARLYAAAVLILAAGLSAAAVLYVNGEDVEEGDGSYLIVNGVAHWVPAETSKTYVRDLRRFGGTAAVLFDDFNRWFAGLWRGKALGVTVAWISVVLAGGLALFARYRL